MAACVEASAARGLRAAWRAPKVANLGGACGPHPRAPSPRMTAPWAPNPPRIYSYLMTPREGSPAGRVASAAAAQRAGRRKAACSPARWWGVLRPLGGVSRKSAPKELRAKSVRSGLWAAKPAPVIILGGVGFKVVLHEESAQELPCPPSDIAQTRHLLAGNYAMTSRYNHVSCPALEMSATCASMPSPGYKTMGSTLQRGIAQGIIRPEFHLGAVSNLILSARAMEGSATRMT